MYPLHSREPTVRNARSYDEILKTVVDVYNNYVRIRVAMSSVAPARELATA